jgi:ribosomal-protein-serine acetyltransferase
MSIAETEKALDVIASRFYALFNNEGGRRPILSDIYELFIPEGLIVKCVGEDAERYTLEQFVTPREKLLTGGTLVDFKEWETAAKTEIHANLAIRVSSYSKRGVLNGALFEASGVKTMQFVRIGGEWKLTATAWYDY